MKRFRLLGVLPLVFFLWTAYGYYRHGNEAELWWICNVSNIALGIGILAGLPALTWVATLWILMGIGPWILDGIQVSGFEAHSFFTHLGSAGIGLFAISRMPTRRRIWRLATLFFFAVQLATRLATGPKFNVNQVYEMHESFRALFTSYWGYYALNTIFFVSGLFAIEWLLRKTVARKSRVHGRS